MEKYIIFFGKSQSFKFYAFDSKGVVNNFDNIIKDFELLESKWFTVENVNNDSMFSRYEFTIGTKKFSMLKLYGYAQASAGTRIEGSIYGVALLSEEPLVLSVANIQLLTMLKKYFSDLSLINSKFKQEDFGNDVFSIMNAFTSQIGFHKIEVGKYLYSSDNNNFPIGILVDNLESAASVPEGLINKSPMVYFSKDLEHLKMTRLKWEGKFRVYINTAQGFIEYKDPEKPRTNQPIESDGFKGNNLNNISTDRSYELERELSKLKKINYLDKLYYKKVLLILSVIFVLLLSLVFFWPNIFEPTVVAPHPPLGTPNTIIAPKSLSMVLIDSVMNDSVKLSMTKKIINEIEAIRKDKMKSNVLKEHINSIYISFHKLNIDSSYQEKIKIILRTDSFNISKSNRLIK
jgi:hypothetical protein